jgi:hypothetical protein
MLQKGKNAEWQGQREQYCTVRSKTDNIRCSGQTRTPTCTGIRAYWEPAITVPSYNRRARVGVSNVAASKQAQQPNRQTLMAGQSSLVAALLVAIALINLPLVLSKSIKQGHVVNHHLRETRRWVRRPRSWSASLAKGHSMHVKALATASPLADPSIMLLLPSSRSLTCPRTLTGPTRSVTVNYPHLASVYQRGENACENALVERWLWPRR